MNPYVPSVGEMPDQDGHDVIAGSDRLSHDIADYPEGIVLPVDKPYRWTSADVIRKLKYAAIRHFGKKNLKVGHAGTLDPLATGVLLVCIGNACKQAQQLQDHDKEYIATIRFGATTPSYDLEKEPDRFFPYKHITREAVEAVLPAFLGEQEQVAPLFSAKSVDGVRAYELARKLYRSGQTDALDATALESLHRSRIVISELELISFCHPERSEGSVGDSSSQAPQNDTAGGRAERGDISESMATLGRVRGRGPAEGWEGSRSDDSGMSPLSAVRSASSRIHVADTSALGLPEAVIRIACSKGTYIRAFARDLGEALGSGAHLSGLVRSRSGAFALPSALSLDQALSLF